MGIGLNETFAVSSAPAVDLEREKVLSIARDPKNYSPGAIVNSCCKHIKCICKPKDEAPPKDEGFAAQPEYADTFFSDEERDLAVSSYLTALDGTDHTNIADVLNHAGDLYILLIMDGDYDNAALLAERLAPWGIDLTGEWNNQTTDLSEKTDTTTLGGAFETFELYAGHTDWASRVVNLIDNGHALKAFQILEVKSATLDFDNLPEIEHFEQVLSESLSRLETQSDPDPMAIDRANAVAQLWELETIEKDSPEAIIADQYLSRQRAAESFESQGRERRRQGMVLSPSY